MDTEIASITSDTENDIANSVFSLNYLKNSGGLRRELKWQNFYFQRFQIFFCADLSVRSLL